MIIRSIRPFSVKETTDRTNPPSAQSRFPLAITFVIASWAALILLVSMSHLTMQRHAVAELNYLDDFTVYWDAAKEVAAGRTPYGWIENGTPKGSYLYPPFLALALAPVTRLVEFTTARWGWYLFSALCLGLGILISARTSRLSLRGRPVLALAPCGIALLPPAILTLATGQVAPQVLLAFAGAYHGICFKGPIVSGFSIAAGAYLKSFPGLLAGYLLLRRRWTALVSTILFGAAFVTFSVVLLGWDPHWMYLTAAIPLQNSLFAAPFNVSITGLLTRILVENAFTVPFISIGPTTATLLIALVTGFILVLTAQAIWRASPRDEDAAFGLAVVTALLASPINGYYNLVICVIPLAILARRAQDEWPRHFRWLLVTALLLAMPIELHDLLPADYPWWRDGLGNLLTSGPLFGLLALWVALMRICCRAESGPVASRQAASLRTRAGIE